LTIVRAAHALSIETSSQCGSCTPDTSVTTGSSSNCYDVCGTTCDYHAAGIDDLPDYAVNISCELLILSESYNSRVVTTVACSDTMACAWMAVADLQTTCSGGFTPSFPTSHDFTPELETPPVVTDPANGNEIDDCSLHAVCTACISSSGNLNKYCAAVAGFYMRGLNESLVNTNAANFVLNDQAYWCNATTLQSIKDGSFDDSCDSSLSSIYPGHC